MLKSTDEQKEWWYKYRFSDRLPQNTDAQSFPITITSGESFLTSGEDFPNNLDSKFGKQLRTGDLKYPRSN